MVSTNVPEGDRPGNPDNVVNLFAQTAALEEIGLRVMINRDLDAVELRIVEGLDTDRTVLLAPNFAIDLALRLLGGVLRLADAKGASDAPRDRP